MFCEIDVTVVHRKVSPSDLQVYLWNHNGEINAILVCGS